MTKRQLDSRANGFSLIEMSVTLLLLTVVLLILYELMIGTMKTSMFVEAHNDLTVYGQRVVNRLQTDILQSRFIWEEDPSIGPAYRQLFLDALAALPSPIDVWINSRMPDIDGGTGTCTGCDGLLDEDISTQTFVGNSLLLVKSLEPVGIPADYDGDCAAESTFYAERYQFKYYFLSPNTGRRFPGANPNPPSTYYLDIVEADSEVYADKAQLDAIFATLPNACQDQLIANGLLNVLTVVSAAERQRLDIKAPINKAWAPNQIAAAAFYDLDSSAGLTLDNTPTFTITAKSMVPEMKGGRISGKMEYSMGFNSSATTGNSADMGGIIAAIPRFGLRSSNFPGGFEVKIVGPTGHRKVLTRVVLLSEHMGIINSQENFVITSTRQF